VGARTIVGFLAVAILNGPTFAEDPAQTLTSHDPNYAPLLEGITSFGTAIVEDVGYVYGAHKGRAPLL